jgi:glycosyltransferase involved in cell wall biosynthesis
MTMRVLVITDLFPPIGFGGYERTCADLVDGLDGSHEVTVLTSDLRRDAAPPEPRIRRELAYLGPERRELARVPVAAARAANVTRRVLAEVRPHVVYVSNCLVAPQAAPWVAAQAGVPVVYRLSELWFASTLYRGDRFVGHLFPGQRGLHRPWSWFVRGVNRHPALRLDRTRAAPAAISWCSDDLRACVGLPPSVIPVLERTIYPGTTSPFAALARRPDARPLIVYAGRVTAAKGADVAVEALAELRAEHGIDARLGLAGHCDPVMERSIRGLAAALGISDHVGLCGPLDTEALGRLLERAHAVVVPTVTHEAFGRICVEAALARVPVVASRLGGIPEALREDEHALHFPPGDAAACAAALAVTLEYPSAAAARVRRAFAHAQRFSVERFVAASEALLRDTVNSLRRIEWRASA